MNIEQAKQILKEHGRPTCPCKYNGSQDLMIEEAKKMNLIPIESFSLEENCVRKIIFENIIRANVANVANVVAVKWEPHT
jgi:hypothetical protein